MSSPETLLVFSHLRWNFVYQRPQHLMARLSHHRRVVIVEEPTHTTSREPFWQFSTPSHNILVCQPYTSVRKTGFTDEQMPALSELTRQLIDKEKIDKPIAWFYTPLAMPLFSLLNARAVVYDCMDELSAFLNAPAELIQREKELLNVADIVFTGGPSLYRAKKDLHSNVHCFPSSVDARHFGRARDASIDAPDQAQLPHPRLGFFGVIDERFDVQLIDQLAKAHPEWSVSLIGPVVKIDPASLPRRPNIHYFGQRSYEELPGFLTGWDVCLLPFARNDSTRYISPTKTLEYMAAEKPIVSTPITDVAQPYGDIVRLGDSPEEFIAACEQALCAPPNDVLRRTEMMRNVLARTSWNSTASAMNELIEKVVHARDTEHVAKDNTMTRTTSADRTPPVLVIGAGPTGLSAAYHLGEDALLLERESRVGGWCKSIEADGFTFDYAGHIMFSNDAYVHELYKKLLGDNVHWQDREAWVFSKGVYTRYPFQGALYGLPPEVIKECIVGAIEARYGELKKANGASNGSAKTAGLHIANGPHGSNGHSNGADKNLEHLSSTNGKDNGSAHTNGSTNGNGRLKPISDCCADGIMESTAELLRRDGLSKPFTAPQNFEDFIYKVWGAGIAKHFAIPYNRKLWAVPLHEMETSWLGGRVPMPDLEEMIEGALKPVPKPMGPNARFGYPLKGGFQALMNGFLPLLKGPLRSNTRISAISPSRHTVTLGDGAELPYEKLISTMPLPALVRGMWNEAPEEVRQAAAGLRHVSVRCVHLGVGRESLTEKHWIYYPEDTIFHRIFVQGNASPHCNAPGGFGLTCEITYSHHKPLPCDGDELIQRCIEDCRKVGIFNAEDPVIAAVQCDMPHAYVVYDHARPRNVAIIREWMAKLDIILSGRYSEWEYYNSDHAFLAGKKAAERARQSQKDVVTVAV